MEIFANLLVHMKRTHAKLTVSKLSKVVKRRKVICRISALLFPPSNFNTVPQKKTYTETTIWHNTAKKRSPAVNIWRAKVAKVAIISECLETLYQILLALVRCCACFCICLNQLSRDNGLSGKRGLR